MNTVLCGAHRIVLGRRFKNLSTVWKTTVAPLLGLMIAGAIWPSVQASERVTGRRKEIEDVLINPAIGFTTFQRFNGDCLNERLKWTEGFPVE